MLGLGPYPCIPALRCMCRALQSRLALTRTCSYHRLLVNGPSRIENGHERSRPKEKGYSIGFTRPNDRTKCMFDTVHARPTKIRHNPRKVARLIRMTVVDDVWLGEKTGRTNRRGDQRHAHEAKRIHHCDHSDTLPMAVPTNSVATRPRLAEAPRAPLPQAVARPTGI